MERFPASFTGLDPGVVAADQLQLTPLTAEAVERIDLKPDAFAQFLLTHLREGTDLFALPDLRAGQPTRA